MKRSEHTTHFISQLQSSIRHFEENVRLNDDSSILFTSNLLGDFYLLIEFFFIGNLRLDFDVSAVVFSSRNVDLLERNVLATILKHLHHLHFDFDRISLLNDVKLPTGLENVKLAAKSRSSSSSCVQNHHPLKT